MFKCGNCNAQQPKGVRPIPIVTEKREREYRDKENKLIATGWEIVREQKRCASCAA